MPVIIGNAVGAKHLSKFIIEVKFMHGDADAYSFNEIVLLSTREDLVEEAVSALKELDAIPWNDRRDGYGKVASFCKWFGEGNGEEDSEWYDAFYNEGNRSIDWPGDSTCDYQYRAMLSSWKVFYYDAFGVKINVKVVD